MEKLTLASGESTGHSHDLMGAIEVSDGTNKFVLKGQGELIHEEHKSIIIPPGEYLFGQVKEYDHFEEEIRQIKD